MFGKRNRSTRRGSPVRCSRVGWAPPTEVSPIGGQRPSYQYDSAVPSSAVSLANGFMAASAAVLLAMFLIPAQLQAQGVAEENSKYVVPRSRDFPLHPEKGDLAARSHAAYRIYRVVKSEGPKLWLKTRRQPPSEGWVSSEQVVPLDQAIDYFSKQIRANPRDTFALVMRGIVLSDSSEFDKAIADFSEAIRVDPKFVIAFIGRGSAWGAKAEFDKAIADATAAIALDRGDSHPLALRATAWADKGDHAKAIADVNEAVRLDPQRAMARANPGHDLSRHAEL